MSLEKYMRCKKEMGSPHRRMQNMFNPSQETSFYICLRGSYTLEAAVVLPLMAIYLVTMLSIFNILEIQCAVDEAILYAGRKTAVECSVIDSEELLFLAAETHMLYALRENALVERYVNHGRLGIQLWKSTFYGDEIVLHAEYIVKLPFSFDGIGEISLSSQNIFRKWTYSRDVENAQECVYVTKYGKVYHKDLNCRSVQLSVQDGTIEMIPSLRGKNGQRYYECARCDWKDEKKERIYYTEYGTLYHKDISCSAIKRLVEKIELKEIGERRPCSYCYE